MENRIIALVAEHLLNEQFRSKKQMANALGLQYRTLLNACSGKCSSRCYEKVLNATLRYARRSPHIFGGCLTETEDERQEQRAQNGQLQQMSCLRLGMRMAGV